MKRFWNAPWRYGLCFTAVLLAAFSWALLDAFVIPRREQIAAGIHATVARVAATLAPDAKGTDSTEDAENAMMRASVDRPGDASATAGGAAGTGGASATAGASGTGDASNTGGASAAAGASGAAGTGDASSTAAASGTGGASDAGTEMSDSASAVSSASAPVITPTSYADDHIQITLETLRRFNTTCYVAYVTLSDVSSLRTAFAEGAYGRNLKETTSSIAAENGALLAINGDYYGFRRNGYVLRNGVCYRENARSGDNDLLLVDMRGNFSTVSETALDPGRLEDGSLWQVFSFGPKLLCEGEVAVAEGAEVAKSMTSNPRTAIGQLDALHYVFFVSDGRTAESAGLTLYELASVLWELDCQTAYNLDGGGSSTMVFMGEVVNRPTTNGDRIVEREVSDIVYVGL